MHQNQKHNDLTTTCITINAWLPFGIVTLSFALTPADDTLNGTVILSGLLNGREVEMDVTGTAK